MGKASKKIWVLVLLVLCISGWWLYFLERNKPVETITKIERHTDTIRIEKPYPVFHTIKSFALLDFPVDSLIYVAGDTVQVQVPVESKIFQDSTFKCQVSGWKPSLDWIEVYSPTTTITQVERVKLKPKVSVGIGASVVWNPITHQFDGGLSVGVYVPLWSWY